MAESRRILVTGAGGFIGANIVSALIEKNKIIGIDNERRNTLQYFPGVRNNPNFTYVKGDILDDGLLGKLVKDAEIVLHLAAIAGVSTYYREPFATLEVNAIGTYKLLKAMQNSKVKQFINFSSSEVYGTRAVNARETDETVQGAVPELRWVYSVSKIAAEHMCFAFRNGVNVTSVRPFNVYGQGQSGEGAIRNFISNALKNENLEVTGDGKQVRSWCHVTDMVQAVMLILDNPEKAAGNTFNIGNPEAKCTTLQLAKTIIRLSGSKSSIVFKKHIGVDIRERFPNIEKATEILGFKPMCPLEEGLKQAIGWYRSL